MCASLFWYKKKVGIVHFIHLHHISSSRMAMLQTSERISLHARSISLMVLFNNSSVSIHCTSHNYACLPSNFRYNGPPIFQHKFIVNKKTGSTFFNTSMFTLKLVRTCWENWKYALTMHCINIFEIALSNPTPPMPISPTNTQML